MDLMAIGAIRTAFGVLGWVKVISFSDQWDHFTRLERVKLLKESQMRDAVVEGFREHHGGGIMKFSGVDSPEQGKALGGWKILVPREEAAPLGINEWYLSDLIGLELIGMGKSYGRIRSVIAVSDDLLEVERPDGRCFLIPFRKEFVGIPKLDAGTLELTAPWMAEDE